MLPLLNAGSAVRFAHERKASLAIGVIITGPDKC